jgi:predicted ester cyclase
MDLKTFYGRYIERCNEHRFEELGEFVAETAEVNGVPQTLEQYAAGLRIVTNAFPDFHWEVQEILEDDGRLAVRLIDTYTKDGEPVRLQELSMYRIQDERIVAVWGDLEPVRL